MRCLLLAGTELRATNGFPQKSGEEAKSTPSPSSLLLLSLSFGLLGEISYR